MTRVIQIEETMISFNRELKEYWKRQVESSGSNSKSVVRLAANSLRPNILCRRLADLINSFNKVCVTLFVSIPISQLSMQDSRLKLKRILYSTSTVKNASQLQPITKKQKLCVVKMTTHLSFSSLESMSNDYNVTSENNSSKNLSVYSLPQSSFPYSCKV